MSNDTEIRPALTAEEWSDRSLSEEDENGLGTCIDAQGEPTILTVTPVVPEPDGGWRVGMGRRQRIDIQRRHAIAALALHEQPFGFTREDLRMLQRACFFTEVGRDTTALHERCVSLAARITALLPPN